MSCSTTLCRPLPKGSNYHNHPQPTSPSLPLREKLTATHVFFAFFRYPNGRISTPRLAWLRALNGGRPSSSWWTKTSPAKATWWKKWGADHEKCWQIWISMGICLEIMDIHSGNLFANWYRWPISFDGFAYQKMETFHSSVKFSKNIGKHCET